MKIEDVVSFHAWREQCVNKTPLVHVIGIAGVAMAPLALLLRAYGCEVQGSDKDFYPPMSDMLEEANLRLFKGFSAENLSAAPDLVVVGNIARRDNPEVLETVRRKIPYTIFPKLLDELVIKHEDSIVVTGTHGKTTVTGILIHVAKKVGLEPSYFIGGRITDGPSLFASSGALSIVEGDEYDSAFFAKVPKFQFYGASKLLINALDFDHADIYANREQIVSVFEAKLATLASGTEVIVCCETEVLATLVDQLEKRFETLRFITYATSEVDRTVSYRIQDRNYRNGFQQIAVGSEGMKKNIVLSTRLRGKFNALNVLAAYIAMRHKVSEVEFSEGIAEFTGVLRRQTVLFDDGENVVIEDFAHHPVEVRCLLESMRECYPSKNIIALFEPRSNSSRRNIFFEDYVESLTLADEVYIKKVPDEVGIELLRTEDLVEVINSRGKNACVIDSGLDIVSKFKECRPTNSVIVVMSNGSFDRIYDQLKEVFRAPH